MESEKNDKMINEKQIKNLLGSFVQLQIRREQGPLAQQLD